MANIIDTLKRKFYLKYKLEPMLVSSTEYLFLLGII